MKSEDININIYIVIIILKTTGPGYFASVLYVSPSSKICNMTIV